MHACHIESVLYCGVFIETSLAFEIQEIIILLNSYICIANIDSYMMYKYSIRAVTHVRCMVT